MHLPAIPFAGRSHAYTKCAIVPLYPNISSSSEPSCCLSPHRVLTCLVCVCHIVFHCRLKLSAHSLLQRTFQLYRSSEEVMLTQSAQSYRCTRNMSSSNELGSCCLARAPNACLVRVCHLSYVICRLRLSPPHPHDAVGVGTRVRSDAGGKDDRVCQNAASLSPLPRLSLPCRARIVVC